MPDLPLSGRVAIVTGANHGIGAAPLLSSLGSAPMSSSPISRTRPPTTIPVVPPSTAPSVSRAPRSPSQRSRRLAGGSTPSRPTWPTPTRRAGVR